MEREEVTAGPDNPRGRQTKQSEGVETLTTKNNIVPDGLADL
jgi:hypothetical protein